MPNLPLLAPLTVLLATTQSAAPPTPDAAPTITVTGSGQVRAAPDLAIVQLGASSQADDAATAQADVNASVQSVIAAVRALGIGEKQVQTTGIWLHPVYSPPEPRGEPSEPRVVGYRASNTIRVRVTDLAQVGPVIDAAIGAGANQVENVSFDLKDDADARAQALRKAVKDARQKAVAIAEALDRELGEVEAVHEGGVDRILPETLGFDRAALKMGADTPVEPGQLTITANVTVRYRIGR